MIRKWGGGGSPRNKKIDQPPLLQAYTYTHMAHMHIHTHAYSHTRIHTHAFTHTMHTLTHMHMCVCVCIHVHTHSHIHRNTVGQQIHSERSALFCNRNYSKVLYMYSFPHIWATCIHNCNINCKVMLKIYFIAHA